MAVGSQVVANVRRVVREGVRRRNIGRANCRAGRTARDGLWWRRSHHVGEARARLDKTSLNGGDSSLVGSSMLALAPP